MYPAAQGTKHCQRKRPLAPVRKVNVIVWCAFFSVHGALPPWFLALSSTPCSGTETPSCGTAKTCDAVSGSIACVVLPLSVNAPPTVPMACEMKGLRRPESPSYWKTVIVTSECAGTIYVVLCCQL